MPADEDLIARAQAKKRLEREHPGWRFFWSGGQWHAHPRPLLHGASEADISNAITEAHADAGKHWPALRFVEGTGVPAQQR